MVEGGGGVGGVEGGVRFELIGRVDTLFQIRKKFVL